MASGEDVAAALRARAEKAWSYSAARAEALDEAASLVEALRSPARDDLADELDDLADRLPFGSPTVSRAVLDEDRRNLRNAAEALRASAPSEARCDPADFDALDDYFFGDAEGSKRAEDAWERISAVLEPATEEAA